MPQMRENEAHQAYTFTDLLERAIQRLRLWGIELPSEKELTRIVHTALNGFFSDVHHQVTQQLSFETHEKLDQLLMVPEEEAVSTFEKLKASAGPLGIASLQQEIQKLQQLRSVGISKEHLVNIPSKIQRLLARRAKNETASKMREHPSEIRYGLMACFINTRTMEIIDSIVEMFVAMIHRIDVRAENKRDRELLTRCDSTLLVERLPQDLKLVDGKTQILFRVAEAIIDNPDGNIRDVIFPKVKEETFRNLVAEKEASGPQYQLRSVVYLKP